MPTRAEERLICLRHYSHGKLECACCNEDIYHFLSLDHINGGGTKHNKEIGKQLYHWIIKNNFPDEFRVLCLNCNGALGKLGYCPHKPKKGFKKRLTKNNGNVRL